MCRGSTVTVKGEEGRERERESDKVVEFLFREGGLKRGIENTPTYKYSHMYCVYHSHVL